MDTREKLKYMSEGDIKEVIKIALDNLENNPDSFLQAQASGLRDQGRFSDPASRSENHLIERMPAAV